MIGSDRMSSYRAFRFQALKSNVSEVAIMSTAVFELLAANLAHADCYCVTPPDKATYEKKHANGAAVCLG